MMSWHEGGGAQHVPMSLQPRFKLQPRNDNIPDPWLVLCQEGNICLPLLFPCCDQQKEPLPNSALAVMPAVTQELQPCPPDERSMPLSTKS